MSMEYDEDDPLANRNRAADLERIKKARKNRITQLKNWEQYDKLMEKKKIRNEKSTKANFLNRKIRFPQSLVLLEAAGRGDIDEVNQILLNGADPNVCNDDGLTALHQCCIDNNIDICNILLQHNVNVNATDSEMWTPLHAAAACAHSEICAALIESGAELLALNAEGNMPYDICEDENTLDLIENAMATRGISQDEIDERRKTPEVNMLQALQSQDVDFTTLDEQGATFLHVAASCGFIDVGKFLLDCGVAVDILDKDGWQPLHVAACWGQLEFIELLLLRGADINGKTTTGETVYEICEDTDMNEKLLAMKEEIERQHEIKKTRGLKPALSNLNRRSTSSKRSASIRRSSMREKNLMSWKEARQEALIKEAVEKKITPDFPNEPVHDPSRSLDLPNITTTEEIDINQVLLDVQIETENELARKEPFIRRGSSRNSFTHFHPYHSPSRDPSLMEMSVDEESDTVNMPVDSADSAKLFTATPSIQPPSSVRISQRNGKNVRPVSQEVSSVSQLKKPTPVNNNSTFIRDCNPNMSVKSTGSRAPPQSQSPPTMTAAAIRPVRPKREIDNRLIKQQKTQGCCVVM